MRFLDAIQHLSWVCGLGHRFRVKIVTVDELRIVATLFLQELDHLGHLLVAEGGQLKGELRAPAGGFASAWPTAKLGAALTVVPQVGIWTGSEA